MNSSSMVKPFLLRSRLCLTSVPRSLIQLKTPLQVQPQQQLRYYHRTSQVGAFYRPRVLIIGSGWGGNTLARRLDKSIFDVRLISPANHFLFTPLLPSTAVGTLEFRAIQEPVRTIPGLTKYYQAKAKSINRDNQTVQCEDLFQGNRFDVKYDYLVLAPGNKTNTFNTPGVAEREGRVVFFLKHLYHARKIRNRVLECFERASNPNITDVERDRLLSFMVVGGGPTSCEFTTELYDFLRADVSKWYPDLIQHIRLTLVEAGPGLLGSFHQSLADYYLKALRQKKIDVRVNTAVVGIDERVEGNCEHYTFAKLADGTEVPFGTMVWSAGLAPVEFVASAMEEKQLDRGRIVVDDYMRVPDTKGRIFAMGDCAITQSGPLPPTASVAEQQAYYLGDCFNKYYHDFDVRNIANLDKELPLPGNISPALMPWDLFLFMNKILCKSAPEFQYKNRGAMAGMGFGSGVVDLTNTDLPSPKMTIDGAAAFATWRATYLTKQLSWSNMVLIPMYWFKALVFGRDISRF